MVNNFLYTCISYFPHTLFIMALSSFCSFWNWIRIKRACFSHRVLVHITAARLWTIVEHTEFSKSSRFSPVSWTCNRNPHEHCHIYWLNIQYKSGRILILCKVSSISVYTFRRSYAYERYGWTNGQTGWIRHTLNISLVRSIANILSFKHICAHKYLDLKLLHLMFTFS